MTGKILHIGRKLSIERCWRTNLVCPKYSGLVAIPGNFAIFPSFTLGNCSSITKTDTELLFKYELFFFLKNDNLTINWVPSLLYKHTVPDTLSSQSNKMKSVGLQKPNFSTLYWIGKNLEVQPRFIFKKFNFPSFSWIVKNEKLN